MHSKFTICFASIALTAAFAAMLHAQSAPAPAGAQPAAQQQTAAQPQKIAPVSTTIVVRGNTHDDYLPDSLATGTLDGAPLQQAPIAATVVTRALMTDQSARLLTDVIKNDASVGENYAPVGYYSGFQIRGFAVDLATGLQINGMTIAGEQDVPLENKQSVEILKGLAGVESGVASAGGLIGFVTKRPALVRALDTATDQRGTAYGAADFGHFFGSRKQVGLRVNLAGEHMMSYLNGADGWRGAGAVSADWKPNAKSQLSADFEYQHKRQRSQSGYQLLGGTQLPEIHKLAVSTMLGLQPWQKPNIFDAHNTSARYTYELPRGWRLLAAASYSHSLIDDNVVYAYGNSLGDPYYFFAADGTYDIYDYRNPGELRIDAVAKTLLSGTVRTGAFTHDLSAGGELFLRTVQMPGYYSTTQLSAPDGTGQSGSVYYYIGSQNIYQPQFTVDLNAVETPYQIAGPRRLYENNRQSALILQDRIHLPGHAQLLAAGRYDALRDHNYSAHAGDPTVAPVFTDKHVWLPQFAATYAPTATLTIYGNYGVLLSLGQQAPWWTANGSQYLDPYFTRQAEIGAKYAPSQKILVTAAFFRMHAPYFYPRPLSTGEIYFEADGREHHEGIELNAEGKAARWLRLTASATAMNAKSVETSTAAYNDRQVLNQPHFRAALFADVAVPRVRGLRLLPGWNYTGRKEATRDNTVSVNGYNLFNLGARYTPGGENGRVTFRVYADNVANERYWKDTGGSGGDSFLYLGAPATVRLSAHYTF